MNDNIITMSNYIPKIRHRRSIRVKNYDYSTPGLYFITICTYKNKCIFGKIADSEILLNKFGRVVEDEWFRTEEIRKEIELDEFIIMPNHLHGIVFIKDLLTSFTLDRATSRSPLQQINNLSPTGPKKNSLGAFIAGFKSAATRRINVGRGSPGAPVWQRNYYEHMIRNERSLKSIREYIMYNPFNWGADPENPNNLSEGNDKHRK